MLANVPLRTKITALVAVLLIALSGLGLLGLLQMRTLNTSTVDIGTNWMPSVRVLGEMRTNVALYRNTLRAHLLEATTERKLATEKQVAAFDEAVKQSLRTYASMVATPEERKLYDSLVASWTNYTSLAPTGLEMSRKAAGELPVAANDYMAKTMGPISAQIDEVLKKDIDLNDKGAAGATASAEATYLWAIFLMIGILVVAIVIGITASILVIRDLSRGIASIVKPMQDFTRGDLSAEVPHRGKNTEIGAMADALQVFKQALLDKLTADAAAARDSEDKIARGHRIDAATRQFEASVGEIVETVSSASTELEASARTLTTTAQHAQVQATTVAAASEQASTNVQSVASATEEMTSSINEISRQVQESARIAVEAVDQARRTNATVGELSQAAARIGDVVELINTIAGQTNLLALNATIEAARAGEAGRGFAVVAAEVKALAEQTSKATGEISQHIGGIQAATGESVSAIREIGHTIERMSEIASTIASAVEEQGAATQEIARNVQQAARGTNEVSANIVDVQRGASETGSASAQVLSAAQSLSQDSSRLKVEVANFLQSVRSA
ncbi:hypothetical protein I8G32_01679 [Rhodopseudomonas palustris]|uniref:Methyl-accepting chemotaxis protein n=1 Tax=Rhodopseudomonas palustris (strain ATCC BAA-98 / CGA009) TaxID=258594 RepID=Q6N9A9_RHOPA|nr:methyl-accepting chemotaxis protein [Rhodopseudomonas palustris]ACF00356.1 methyl-accepting chemotaxis sensory transducer [Rhodopseudomonas palustris TIE-1]OPF91141.1 methyl-accepting chemotaxis protein [Rhodopseudomonas palustris]QQM03141.1 hypothetical protein I8G32_01679 [Rhodopseudomonas palustris]RJF68390.1 methyl-accepting chemotaxis protein [Rhodopseudomonas palustris]WAB79307.1 methyl-accepting chemotaxis protein [Rhodopseudomonas palustris]